jgi:alkanesulfonate monooxygenase
VRLGLQLNDYSGLGEVSGWGNALGRIARTADDVGFARLSVTDHLWQISLIGEEDDPVLEAYTTLGFLAAHTRTIELQALVSAVTYRSPGLLGKIISTLDVLSGGRAWLGIGTGWNEQETTGLGLPFGRLSARYKQLEETLQICAQMFSGSRAGYLGRHYQLSSTLNVPLPLHRPRVLIGGSGERYTLRLAAKYADAINVYGGPDAGQKVSRLREHCEQVGRDFDSIEKTALLPLCTAGHLKIDDLLGDLERLHRLGFTTVYGYITDLNPGGPELETLGAKVIPEIADW